MKTLLCSGFRRAISILLCVLILSTVSALPLSVAAADNFQLSSVAAGNNDLAQLGVTLDSASDVIAVSNSTEGSKPVLTETRIFSYVKDAYPVWNGRYAIRHEATGNIMSYSATQPELPATSLVYNQAGNVDDAYYFAENADGTLNTDVMFFDQSNRDGVLWLLRQTTSLNYGTEDADGNRTIQDYEELSYWSNKANNKMADPFFGSDKRYHHAYFFKGNGPTWNENGTMATANNGAYWYSVIGLDADEAGNQERFLRLYDNHADMYGTATVNTQIENLEDGTFLIFRRDTAAEPDSYYMLTCDEQGNWFSDVVTELTDESISDYKLTLYRYGSNLGYKSVYFKGAQNYDVLAGSSKAQVIDTIMQNITVLNANEKQLHIPCSGDIPKVGYYWLEFDKTFDSSSSRANDDYVVSINYRNDDGTDTRIGALAVFVHDEIPIFGTASITIMSGTCPENANEGYTVRHIVDDVSYECNFNINVNTANGVVTKTVPITIGMLTDANGNIVSTLTNGVYKNLTVTYNGEVITNEFTLTVDDSDTALNYPIYPDEGSVKVSKTGNAVGKFNETGVANINLSTTAIPQNRGVDMIVIMDLSGSMSYGVTNTIRVNETNAETSRLYALQESLRSMINTLQESDVDYRIAMSDFGDIDAYEFDGAIVDKSIHNKYFFDGDRDGYWDTKGDWQFGTRREFYNHLNFVHGTYLEDVVDEQGNVITDYDNRAMTYNIHEKKYEKALLNYTGEILPHVYTGSRTVNAEAFVNVDDFDNAAVNDLLEDIAVHQKNSLGTNYDVGLEYAYQLGHAVQEQNIANGEDRDVICVFMSDGAAMQYNYFSGRALSQSWADWLKGDIEYEYYQHNAPSSADDSVELTTLMTDLFAKLEKGTLKNPSYGVRETVPNANGTRNKNNASELLTPKSVTDSTTKQTTLYFDFSAVDVSGATTFYDAMELIGVGIHWNLLCRIADANGLKGYTSAADVEDQLLALAKANNLKYPDDVEEFYPQYTGTSTDFFAAMEELGYPVNWELFAQIATENVNDGRLDDVYNELTALTDGNKWGTLSPYYYFYNEDGNNWYAEAIKGSRNQLYPVVNKNAFSNSTDQPFDYYGDVRNNFDTGTGLALDGQDYISGYRGLDIPIYTVGLSLCTENYLTEQIAKDVLANISSGPNYAYTANNKDELVDIFNSISASASIAATGSYFVDKMGPEFDLFTRRTVINGDGKEVTIDATPTIRVLEYNLDANHKRTGNPIVYETVTISEDANGNLIVTSDKIYNVIEDSSGNFTYEYPNILDENGIIKARYFYYNTNKFVDEQNTGTKGIDLTGDGKDDWKLEAETFFWVIGPIGQTEMVLDYMVYLTGSLEGEREGFGVYDTNTSATLNYVNYLGNNCSKDTITPSFPWPNPFVGYSFYLVDEDGNPINANGDKSSFVDSVKITSPEYIEMILNSAANVIDPNDKLSNDLSLVYELYDPSVSYKVAINSDNSGYWDITKTEDLKDSTYVTNYGAAATNKNSADLNEDNISYDRTVVWFALKLRKVTRPDTVVIDYGLPVKANVLENDDPIGDTYKLKFIGESVAAKADYEVAKDNYTDLSFAQYLSTINPTDSSLVNTSSYDGAYGNAEVVDNQIKYTLNTSNGMQMSEEEEFIYSALDSGTGADSAGKGYRYSTLTVIPATSIYYEDNFINFNVMDHDTGKAVTEADAHYDDLKWKDAGTEIKDATQAQDRPGEFTIEGLDANNIYGYDDAYSETSMYSLGTSKVINVGSHTFGDGTHAKTRATADFTFKGTGFDIVSLTSNTTGNIVIQVVGKDANVASVNKFYMVDTYYGYKWNGTSWEVDTDAEGALYQVPVMKIEDLPYGKYDVTITIAYAELFDHQQYGDSKNFDFYLDAIRIYDPANNGADSDVVLDAYLADGEGWPKYDEVRNLLLDANKFADITANDILTGVVFIDNTTPETPAGILVPTISTYQMYGPNNEVYIAPQQAISFYLDDDGIERAHIAMRTLTGGCAKVKVFDASLNQADVEATEIKTGTDLYYDITKLAGKTVVIYNSGTSADDILSVTNLKTTYASDPGPDAKASDNVKMTLRSAELALNALTEKSEEETTATETTAPVSSTPETTPTETTATQPSVPESQPATDATDVTTAPTEPVTSTTGTETTSDLSSSTEPTTTAPVEVYLLGDADMNKTLNIKDATLIQKHSAMLVTLEGTALKAADFDMNTIVNVKDATGIQKRIAGLTD